MSRFLQGDVPNHFTTTFLKFAQVKLQTMSKADSNLDNPAVIKKKTDVIASSPVKQHYLGGICASEFSVPPMPFIWLTLQLTSAACAPTKVSAACVLSP